MADKTLEVDLLVLGGGMAGLTAAGYAASRGARVMLAEKAGKIGGSAAISGGHLWTAPSEAIMRERCPTGDPALGAALVNRFAPAVDWVRSTGVEFTKQIQVLYGRGYRFDILTYFNRCQAIIESAQGYVLLNHSAQSLLVDDGGVTGAVFSEGDDIASVRAAATVLATGGWQGDKSMLRHYFPRTSDKILHRSNGVSSGDGLRLARAAGAGLAGDMSTFYGHLSNWPLPRWEPPDFVLYLLLYSDQGILINREGRRYTDESLGDHVNAQATAKQTDALALLLLDRRLRETAARAPAVEGLEQIDRLEEPTRVGAHVAGADALEDLGSAVAAWGFDGAGLSAAVEEFNADVVRGIPGTIARRWNRQPFGPGPYYALEVKPGITFTEGGLRVSPRAEVLREDRTPIDGLFAAGADMGGVFDGGYAGGLALACVFGLTAVESVLGPQLFSARDGG